MSTEYEANSGDGENGIPPINKEKMAMLVKHAIGKSSIIEFCSERSVSRSTVSAILSQRLDKPPRAQTLIRIAGDDEKMAVELLKAAGRYSEAVHYLKLEKENDTFSSDSVMQSAAYAIPMVIAALQEHGKRNVHIEYWAEGSFLIASDSSEKIVFIPAFTSSEESKAETIAKALRLYLASMLHWADSKPSGYVFVTNWDSVFQSLKIVPSVSGQMAVLLTDGRTICEEYVIPYTGPAITEDISSGMFSPFFQQETSLRRM